jgi:putative PIN family toxin of toxin-antitoxin system
MSAPSVNANLARAVLDTNVLVAAFRSRRGASFQVVYRLRHGEWTAVLSNHLLYEYEEVLKRSASELGLSLEDVDEVLNAVCARAEEWTLPPDWQPVLTDPDDEPLVQLAEESGANVIVTHNTAHLQPARKRGIRVLPPREFLAILRVR